MTQREPLDLTLLAAAVTTAGYPEPVREHRFADELPRPRQWRLDLAWPALLVAFEREGFAPGGRSGRHQRVRGYEDDCEKYSTAAALGWAVIRASGRQIESGLAADLVLRALAERRRVRGVVLGLAERITAQCEILARSANRRA